jgi:hypothetical protein
MMVSQLSFAANSARHVIIPLHKNDQTPDRRQRVWVNNLRSRCDCRNAINDSGWSRCFDGCVFPFRRPSVDCAGDFLDDRRLALLTHCRNFQNCVDCHGY